MEYVMSHEAMVQSNIRTGCWQYGLTTLAFLQADKVLPQEFVLEVDLQRLVSVTVATATRLWNLTCMNVAHHCIP